MFATVAELCQYREMLTLHFLAHRRERRARVEQDAADLLRFLGNHAYYEARTRARTCRGRRDRAGDRHWSRVAVEVARREGRVIGEKVADRYEANRDRPWSRPVHRDVARAMADIARGVADLARSRGDATTLHNVGAWVRQVMDLAGSTPEVILAGDAVIAACKDLARAAPECAAALKTGIYPPPAETAGLELRRLRVAVEATPRTKKSPSPSAPEHDQARRPPGRGSPETSPTQVAAYVMGKLPKEACHAYPIVEEIARKLGGPAVLGTIVVRSQADLAQIVRNRLPVAALKGLSHAGLTPRTGDRTLRDPTADPSASGR